MQHLPEHEEILALLFGGELSPEDPPVADLLANCEVCAQEIDELLGLSREIDRVAVSGRDAVHEPTSSADQGTVTRVLEEVWGEEPRRGLRLVPLLALAAVLLVLVGGFSLLQFGGWPTDDPGGGGGRQLLGEISEELVSPTGELPEGVTFSEFVWDLPPARNGTFTLRVWNDGATEPTFTVTDLRKQSYEPTPEQLDRLEDLIRWRIDVESSGMSEATYEAWAKRSD